LQSQRKDLLNNAQSCQLTENQALSLITSSSDLKEGSAGKLLDETEMSAQAINRIHDIKAKLSREDESESE
jgi:hypothetical protein